MSIPHGNIENQVVTFGFLSELLPYPIDMSSFLTPSHSSLDGVGVPHQANPTMCSPIAIAQYALAHWNAYLSTRDEQHSAVFLTQARWFVQHEVRIAEDSGGWPLSLPHPDVLPVEPAEPQGGKSGGLIRSGSSVAGSHFNVHTRGAWLSALAQGGALSVLLRAYQLTREEVFLEVAHRAVRTFEGDILDGGVSAPVGADGIFFEEIAVYPATHGLSGFIFALLGLYDYVAVTGDARIEKLISRSLATMHSIIAEFDAGYWTYTDLLHRRLASPADLSLQALLLEALAGHSGCNHCSLLSSRWKSYQRRFGSRLRYLITNRCASFGLALRDRFQSAFFPKFQVSPLTRVCVPLPEFPITGGVLTVMEGIDQVTKDLWQLEFLAHDVGPNEKGYKIHRFGTAKMDAWFFPAVWLYTLAGFSKLFALMHRGADYHVILPQDGVFTGAFAGLAAKLAGARVVCIDHSNLTSLKSATFRAERRKFFATKTWPRHILHRLLEILYWPSLWLLARISARFVDHYLVPGTVGDGVEEVLAELGVHQSRVTRFSSMIDLNRHVVLDDASKASLRETKGIMADAIVIAIICRLSPEKGLDIALESISRALSTLSPDLCARVRVIIAGEGPLRTNLEEHIRARGLSQTCLLWGEISSLEVLSLLAISNIFLYTSTRGACFAMAVLEAMASGCTVIASRRPESNALLLADGRGIAVPPNDLAQTAEALVRLVNDLELCHQMGRAARDYIATQHSPMQSRRNLQRLTYWSALDELLELGKQSGTVERGEN